MPRRKSAAKPPTRVKFVRLSTTAKVPVRATKGSAGYDLFAPDDGKIDAGDFKLVPLQMRLQIPKGWYGQIKSRSGLAKRGVVIEAGTIDSDYTGPVVALVRNQGNEEFEYKRGDRIAQIVFSQHLSTEIQEVDSIEETERGEGGFGSTGLANLPSTPPS